MGNSLNLSIGDKAYLSTVEYFEKTNWQSPEILHLELYEISVLSNPRNYSSYYQIKEIFIPEFNISINNINNGLRNYNIILNSSSRYKKVKRFDDSQDIPKLLKSLCLTKESNPDELEELFDLISSYTKSQNMGSTVKKLFEQIDN
jgi:hypothetical protein